MDDLENSSDLLSLLHRRKTLLLTITCVKRYHCVQIVLCFSEGGRIPWSRPQAFDSVLVLETKTKPWISLVVSGWLGFWLFFFKSSVLWVNLNLWPPLAVVWKSSLTPCLPSLHCRDEGWSSEKVGAGKLRKIFGPEEEQMRLKAWSQ